eukprot:Skav231208  [mRNA]  locus=scaffold1436:22593:26951:+ [translate_table: standard]
MGAGYEQLGDKDIKDYGYGNEAGEKDDDEGDDRKIVKSADVFGLKSKGADLASETEERLVCKHTVLSQ